MSFRLEVLAECGSTNDELFARRGSPDFHGLALLALRQTGGHGRRGREWWSAEGNLALSLGLKRDAGPGLSLIPFAAGLALHDALGPLVPAGADLRLKWPNDVYLNGRKLAGIISQVRQSGNEADLVLGIGLNLLAAPPGQEAIALSELVSPPTPESFAHILLGKLEERLAQPGSASLLGDWDKAARIQGAPLAIVGEAGRFIGRRLLESGELEVECAETGELRRLSSETVSLRFTPPFL